MNSVHLLGWLLAALAAGGIDYTIYALVAVGRFMRMPPPRAVAPEPVTLLKPLHGAEPDLTANLATFLEQDWDAPIELVAGVQDAADPAIEVARGLAEQTSRTVRLVIDPKSHGANAKVSNLVNMLSAASHDLIVLSDSDMSVGRDYLTTVVGAVREPGVGAVTCLYRGRSDSGFWSVLGAAAVSYHFLPSVIVSLALGDARVCMGSTIALRRETLDAIGGFDAFADILADDHAIGAAVRARGLRVAVPRLVLIHAATERSLAELIRHELRWAATVRGVVPWRDYLGLALTQPVAPALVACLFLPRAGFVLLALSLAVRALLWRRVDRWTGNTAPLWLMPVRDLLSTAIFVMSFGVRSVDWRGQRLTMTHNGRIAPHQDSRI